jgi:hypothetical protein
MIKVVGNLFSKVITKISTLSHKDFLVKGIIENKT